jgi:hypothetical protein
MDCSLTQEKINMDYMEATVNFIIPNDDRSITFVNLLDSLINDHVFPRLIVEEFYYYGVSVEEWLLDPPTSDDAVSFSLGIAKAFDELEQDRKFSREKSSPSVDLDEAVATLLDALANFAINNGTIIGDYVPDRSSHVRSPAIEDGDTPTSRDGGSSEYDKGYADGFEAGGGDVSEDLIREREKEVAEMREAAFFERLRSSHVRSSDDDSSEAVDPR